MAVLADAEHRQIKPASRRDRRDDPLAFGVGVGRLAVERDIVLVGNIERAEQMLAEIAVATLIGAHWQPEPLVELDEAQPVCWELALRSALRE